MRSTARRCRSAGGRLARGALERRGRGLIDGAANGVGARARNVGSLLRLIQSGNIRSYATWVLFGSVVLIVTVGILGGLR